MKSTILLAGAVVACVVVASQIGDAASWGGEGAVRTLVSTEVVRDILISAPEIATSFPPFGTILLATLGAAVLLASGLLDAVAAAVVSRLPGRYLSPLVFALGLLAHQLSDALIVVYLPFCALMFSRHGRNPVVGLMLGFASFSGALYAGFGPGLQELVLLSMTHAAATALDPDAVFNAFANWYFCIASAVLMTGAAWFVTDRLVEPRFPASTPPRPDMGVVEDGVDTRRGLLAAAWTTGAAVVVLVGLVAVPGVSPLLDTTASGMAQLTPAFKAGAALIMLSTTAVGSAYGLASGRWRGAQQVSDSFNSGLAALTPFLLMAVGIAFLIRLLQMSGVDTLAIRHLTSEVATSNLSPGVLLSGLAAASAGLDFIVFSASAKWSVMAPLVVPAFQTVGIAPELTTAAFRAGDAVVNILNPLQPAAVLTRLLIARHDTQIDLGRFLGGMGLYSAALAAIALTSIIVWSALGWPTGPS